MKKIIIDLDALSGAARYLEEHNSNGKEREEIAKMMMDDIKRFAFDDKFGGTGTAGYYIFWEIDISFHHLAERNGTIRTGIL